MQFSLEHSIAGIQKHSKSFYKKIKSFDFGDLYTRKILGLDDIRRFSYSPEISNFVEANEPEIKLEGYSHIVSSKPIFSPNYISGVGVVLISPRYMVVSHYLGIDEINQRTGKTTKGSPSSYIPLMIDALTSESNKDEKKKSDSPMCAVVVGGNKEYIGLVKAMLKSEKIPIVGKYVDDVRNAFRRNMPQTRRDIVCVKNILAYPCEGKVFLQKPAKRLYDIHKKTTQSVNENKDEYVILYDRDSTFSRS